MSGWFDLPVADTWFDADLSPDAWFDEDLVVAPTGTPAAPTVKQLSALGVG